MAASFHRPTPASSMRHASTATLSSQVPPSAPVLEFRCMFTHDVMKKQKKWHDGVVKYHTFNKKVMVYDDAKNLVGGVHYRDPEEFAEGLEIKLDRPVLVQVEDQLGESTTDLTPLINRPGGNNTSHSNIQPARPIVSRIPGQHSQIKPKSIKELLAGSQGHIGRARLPLQSPFEQRQALNEIQINTRPSEPLEPPAKKQRLSKKETDAVPRFDRTPAVQGSLLNQPKSSVGSSIRDEIEVVEVMNISSDDEPSTMKNKSRASKTRLEAPKRVRKKGEEPTRNDVVRQKSPPLSAAKSDKHRIGRPLSSSALPTARLAPPSPATKSPSFSAPDLGPRSSLRFPSQKPRPKLMYKALLTGAPAFPDDSSDADNTERRTRLPPRQAQNNLLETDKFFALSQTRQLVSEPDQTLPGTRLGLVNKQTPEAEGEDESQASQANTPISYSPLFLSQPDPIPSQTYNHNNYNDDPDLFLDNLENITSASPKIANIGEDDEQPETESRQAKDIYKDRAYSTPTLSPVVIEPGSLDRQKSPPDLCFHENVDTAPTLTLSSPVESRSRSVHRSTRSFRRVFSETTAVDRVRRIEWDGDFSDDEALSEIALRNNDKSKPVGPGFDDIELGSISLTKVADPAKLSEARVRNIETSTANDPSKALVQNTPLELPVESQTIETGPWTTRESFLLFDWWPPNKQKPDYGQSLEPLSVSTDTATRDGYEDVSASIASRGMSKKYGTFGSAKFVSQQ